MFSRLSIRTKIAVLMTFLLAIVSLAIYLYFPARLHQQIVDSVTQKSAALTGMAAFSVSDGLQERNQAGVAAALNGIRGNPDLVYLMLVDKHGQLFASFNDLIARDVAYTSIPMRAVRTAQEVLQAGQHVERPATRRVVGGTSSDGAIYQSMALVQHRGKTIGKLYAGTSLQSANADAARSRAAIALVTLITFIIGAIAVFALSTVITGPLQRIVETTEEIAKGISPNARR
jgi:sensor histidine kinase regulating citrate/malate metabolism